MEFVFGFCISICIWYQVQYILSDNIFEFVIVFEFEFEFEFVFVFGNCINICICIWYQVRCSAFYLIIVCLQFPRKVGQWSVVWLKGNQMMMMMMLLMMMMMILVGVTMIMMMSFCRS